MPIRSRARRVFTIFATGVSAGILAACANLPDGETVCPERGQGSGSWPYCAPSDPGGVRDDRVNPAGGRN